MQQRGIEMKGEQLPISAIVRCPLLAIRWQLSNQKVRRLQIRFRSNEDFDHVYNHLHHLGLRMSPPQNQSKDRGSTASSEQSKASPRPPISPKRTAAQPTGPSCPPSKLSEISSRPYTAGSAPTALELQIQEAAHARPSSAFPSSGFASSNPLTPPMYFLRPDSASVVPPDYSPSFPPRDQQVASVEQHEASISRPETALLYDRPDTAELPPRRELPFRRDSLPTSSGSDNNRPRSRPSTGIMGPPPLPSRVSDLRPGSARTISLDSELPPLRQPTIVADTTKTTPAQQRPHTPLSPSRGRSKSTQPTTIYENQQTFSPTSSSPQAYPTPASTSPSATRPLSAVSSGAQNRRQSASPGVFASPSASGGKDPTDLTLESAFAGDTVNDLKAYAMQSDDGRRVALNNFIFKSLDSNDFLTLVEDMETNWARLGLGTW
ncbi:hypothetical protein BU25DRAFT_415995 [Macroventuria anomochaeta]|uniref:Uncharacterized protein n=1 Tax=Macroventuria anomochaeta TaxID=301207 RepID=A0ACB6RKC4_9PLEO|nr:uncharacterized protein BU25DRAFT_415995 [Macroventuria anomochaeta]KAF2621614.1 hypothetical protein BU25DRAFT_415995 [Macroventuria anomochaeta]